jgi:hypothetical protein
MKQNGYNPEEDGDAIFWLCHRIAEYLEAHPEPLP